MYAWVRENAAEERKPKDTEEQFIYKARKKAIGPFKRRMWSIDDAAAARHRPVARGAVHLPDAAAEDRRHGGRRRAVRDARRRCRSTARPKSSPPAARSPRPRRRPKGSPTNVAECRLSGDRGSAGRRPATEDHAESARPARPKFVKMSTAMPRAVEHDRQLVGRDRARRIPLTARLEPGHAAGARSSAAAAPRSAAALRFRLVVRRRVVRKLGRRVVHHLLRARPRSAGPSAT